MQHINVFMVNSPRQILLKIGEFQFAPLTTWRRELRKGVYRLSQLTLLLLIVFIGFEKLKVGTVPHLSLK